MPNEHLPTRKHLKRIPVWLAPDERVVYFVTTCCIRRRKVFADPTAVRITLESLMLCAGRLNWSVPRVCVMPDHIHLVLLPQQKREQELSKLMQRWKSSSRQRLNRANIKGDIWQREFFDRLLRSGEDLTDKWNYIEMNPVRAGLSQSPEQYPYLGSPEEIIATL